MKFQLPQFIETEIKIIGPFTLKQFMFIASGTMMVFFLFIVIGPKLIFFVLTLPIAAFTIALAFVKIDQVPLLNYLIYALNYLLQPKRYVYKKDDAITIIPPEQK